MPLIDYQFPEPYGMVKVFVGGCVERGDGSSFRRKAHAHTRNDDPHRGTICVRSPKRLYTPSAKPSYLMWHELAHILTGHGHDIVFVRQMRKFGFKRLDKADRYACRRALAKEMEK